jgi:hypothetical protein
VKAPGRGCIVRRVLCTGLLASAACAPSAFAAATASLEAGVLRYGAQGRQQTDLAIQLRPVGQPRFLRLTNWPSPPFVAGVGCTAGLRSVQSIYNDDLFHRPTTGVVYQFDPHLLPYIDCPLPAGATLPRFRVGLGDRGDGFYDGARLDGVVYGGGGADFLTTRHGVAYGGGGHDALSARVAFGGGGPDEVGFIDFGGVKPTGPAQELHGGTGGDSVEGAGRLYGGNGDDQLLGVGTLTGGAGADWFEDSPLPLGRRLIRARDGQYDIVECPDEGSPRDILLLDGRDYIELSCRSARSSRSNAPRAVAQWANHVYRGRGWRVTVLCPADVYRFCAGEITLRSHGADGPVHFRARAGDATQGLRIGRAPYCRAAATRHLLVRVRSHDATGVWRSATRALDARPFETPRLCRRQAEP